MPLTPYENPGPPPPDLVKQAQDACAATGLAEDLKVTGEGEYTWNKFLLRTVRIEFPVDVADLKDTGAMQTLAAKVKEFRSLTSPRPLPYSPANACIP